MVGLKCKKMDQNLLFEQWELRAGNSGRLSPHKKFDPRHAGATANPTDTHQVFGGAAIKLLTSSQGIPTLR